MIRSDYRELVESLLEGDLKKAEKLIAAGQNINAPCSENGWTALHDDREPGCRRG
jgi:hypothetical protein